MKTGQPITPASDELAARLSTTFIERSSTPLTSESRRRANGSSSLASADVGEADTWEEIQPTHSRAALLHAQWVSGAYWAEHGLRPPAMPEKFGSQVSRIRRAAEMPSESPWRTTRDGIAGLPYPINGHAMSGVPNHEGIPGARTYRGHTGGWFEWPAKTLKAGVHGVCGGEGMIRFTDGSVRYLTVREAARIQTFPD